MSMSNASNSKASRSDYIANMIDPLAKIISLTELITEHLHTMAADPSLAVHEIRKHSKFIRAIAPMEPMIKKALDIQMKRLSRILSPYRDAQVNLETYHILTMTDVEFQHGKLLQALEASPYLNPPLPTPDEIQELKIMIAETLQLLISTPPAGEQRVLTPYILDSYDQLKSSLEEVTVNSDSEAVHSWRKKAKRCWYRVRLVFGEDEQTPDHFLSRLDLLGKQLGEIHDLDMLGEIASTQVPTNWLELLQTHRTWRLQNALADGHNLLALTLDELSQLIDQELTPP
jgi:CHAD domain-containing protein